MTDVTVSPPKPNRQPNLPLLRKVWEWVLVEADKPCSDSAWNQDSWRDTTGRRWDFLANEAVDCGTTYCFAGYTAVLQGATFLNTGKYTPGTIKTADGRHYNVATWAAAELGLTFEEANALFYASDVGEIEQVLRRVARRAGEEW